MPPKRFFDEEGFVALPSSSQALYFHMLASTNASGFCDKVDECMRKSHAAAGDLDALFKARCVYSYSGGLLVVRDSQMHQFLAESIGNTSKADAAIKRRKKQEAKKPYGEFKNVFLTDEEYEKLQKKFKADLNSRIESLSEYIQSTGRRYKSHYATILVWDRRYNGGKSSSEKDFF